MSTLVFLGDVWLPQAFQTKVSLGGPYICNLESPVTNCVKPVPGKINLKSEGLFFQKTFGYDPLAVCLANNHIIDYGSKGFFDTIEILDQRGIKYFGAGTVENNCNNPLIMDINGRLVALMGYVCPTTHPVFAKDNFPGVMPIVLEKIIRDIKKARQNKANQIIVNLHWGMEEVYLPRPEDIKMARDIIDAGADLIIGHHAHCIQSWESYKGKKIFYGLGNTIFPDINVPSYCNEEGEPSHMYVSRQRSWNNKSLMVEYSLDLKTSKIGYLLFNQPILKEVDSDDSYNLNYAGSNYKLRYAWAYRISMLREVIFNFLSKPKLPKLCHLMFLLSLFQKRAKA